MLGGRARPVGLGWRRMAVLGFCGLAAGCGGERLIVGTEAPAGGPGNGGGPGLDGPGASPDLLSMEGCPVSPAARQRLADCWPTPHVGRWRGFFTGRPRYSTEAGMSSDFPEVDLQLSVEDDGTATLVFAGAPPPVPPQAASDPYLCAGTVPETGCPQAQQIVLGFVYTLEQVQLRDPSLGTSTRIRGEVLPLIPETMSFDIPLGEPWRGWCALQAPEPEACPCASECAAESGGCYGIGPQSGTGQGACALADEAGLQAVDCGWLSARRYAPCECSADGCVAAGATLTLNLRMSDDGHAMRGTYAPDGGVEFLLESE